MSKMHFLSEEETFNNNNRKKIDPTRLVILNGIYYEAEPGGSKEARRGKHPSTHKFGFSNIDCHRETSFPVESIQSTCFP